MTDPGQEWLPQEQPPQEQPPAEEPPHKYPFWNWLDVATLAVLAVPLFLIALVAVQVFLFVFSWQPHAKAIMPITVQFLFYGLWFGVLYGLIRVRYGRPFWRSP